MSDSLSLFIRDQIRRARKDLPYEDALIYLRHLALLGEGSTENLRSAVFSIAEGDRQLELIASGQLRLDLNNAD